MKHYRPQRHCGDQIRRFLMRLAFAVAGISLIPAPVLAAEYVAPRDPVPDVGQQPVTVYKRSNCNCCNRWVDHLKDNGFVVDVRNVDSTAPMQSRFGVPDHLRACHTAEVGGYWIEGHVPADLIVRLLDQRPTGIAGLAVPGMPIGSPGMEGPNPQAYAVIAVDADGDAAVHATRKQEDRP